MPSATGPGYYGFLLDTGPAASAGAGLTYYDAAAPWSAGAVDVPTSTTFPGGASLYYHPSGYNPPFDLDFLGSAPYPFSIESSNGNFASLSWAGTDWWAGLDTSFHSTISTAMALYPSPEGTVSVSATNAATPIQTHTVSTASTTLTSAGNVRTISGGPAAYKITWTDPFHTGTYNAAGHEIITSDFSLTPPASPPPQSPAGLGNPAPGNISPAVAGTPVFTDAVTYPDPPPIWPAGTASAGTVMSPQDYFESIAQQRLTSAGYSFSTTYPAGIAWKTATLTATNALVGTHTDSMHVSWTQTLGGFNVSGYCQRKVRTNPFVANALLLLPVPTFQGSSLSTTTVPNNAGTFVAGEALAASYLETSAFYPLYVSWQDDSAYQVFTAKSVLVGATWAAATDPAQTCYILLQVGPNIPHAASQSTSTTSGGHTTTDDYGFLYQVTDNNNGGAYVDTWFISYGSTTPAATSPYGTFVGIIDAFTGRFKPTGVADSHGNQSFHIAPIASYAPPALNTATLTTTYHCLPLYGAGADVTITAGCGSRIPPPPNPPGPGGANGPPAAVEADGPRQWLHVGRGASVATYPAAAPGGPALFTSPDYAVDSWVALRADARRGDLLMLGQQAQSDGSTKFKVFLSTDGGNSAAEVLDVNAPGALIERDSERGMAVVLLQGAPPSGAAAGSTDGPITYRGSTDGGQTFGTSAAAQVYSAGALSPLSATLLSVAYDKRRAALSLLCLVGGSVYVLESTDVGATWVPKAELS